MHVCRLKKKKQKKKKTVFLKPGFTLINKTPHSLYLFSPDPAFTISALPGPCIHYIRSPRTLHSLYPLSPDPAFTISALPGPRIRY
ncbi:unnamed protein product, partial [Staurois parvus]